MTCACIGLLACLFALAPPASADDGASPGLQGSAAIAANPDGTTSEGPEQGGPGESAEGPSVAGEAAGQAEPQAEGKPSPDSASRDAQAGSTDASADSERLAEPPTSGRLPSYDADSAGPADTPRYRDADGAGPGLPGYDLPVSPEAKRPPPAPRRDGLGRITAGSMMLAGGVGLFGGAGILAADGFGRGSWGTALGLGSAATLVGFAMVGRGAVRYHDYRSWAAEQPEPVPRQGIGLIAGGSTLLVSGTLGHLAALTSLAMGNWRGYEWALLGLGTGAIAAGSAMLIVGMVRHGRHARWQRTPRTTVIWQPSAGPTQFAGQPGAWVGVHGQF